MKRIVVLASLLALAAPAAFAAPPPGKGKPDKTTASASSSTSPQSASSLCKEQRRTMGMSAFRMLYAPSGKPKAAMDACLAKLSAQVAGEEKNAAKACKAERAKDPAAFATSYGKNANKKNAFGKCVSSKAKAGTEEEQEATLNAAKKCKAEQAAGAQAFAEKYGEGKKKPFAQCVKVQKGSDSD